MKEEELEELKAQADAGDVDAQYRLGNELAMLAGNYRVNQGTALEKLMEKFHGNVDLVDIQKNGLAEVSTYRLMMRNAYTYYYMAASNGHQMAMYMLGLEYLYGLFLGSKDIDKAYEYLTKVDPSAIDDPGFDKAALYSSLAIIYDKKGDSAKNFEYSGKAAECGDIVYRYSFAKKCFESGNYDIAFRLYKMVEDDILANEDDPMSYRLSLLPDAAYSLAVMYLEGKGTVRNPVEAYNHFDPRLFYDSISQEMRTKFYQGMDRAIIAVAELGQDPEFMSKAAGVCLKNHDYIGALDWYEKAFKMGDKSVSDNLATLLLSSSIGDRRNPPRALELLVEAAKKNDSVAGTINPLYENGDDGIEPDSEKAAHWKSVYDTWAASANGGWGIWGR